MSVNRVTVCGNLTRDGELRETANGATILNLGIAVNERYKNSVSGEWEDRPNFFDCVMFGSRAASLAQYMVKGQKIVIDGKLRWSQWEKDGQKRSKVEIIVDELEFAGSRRESASAGDQVQSAQTTTYTAQPAYTQPVTVVEAPSMQFTTPVQADVYDEDIPF
jgi:single-strand DNA-binding protein